jgi:hypothetical protein
MGLQTVCSLTLSRFCALMNPQSLCHRVGKCLHHINKPAAGLDSIISTAGSQPLLNPTG